MIAIYVVVFPLARGTITLQSFRTECRFVCDEGTNRGTNRVGFFLITSAPGKGIGHVAQQGIGMGHIIVLAHNFKVLVPSATGRRKN